MMKKILIVGMCAMPFFFTACGGSEVEGTDTDLIDEIIIDEEIEEIVTIANYAIETDSSIINWNNFEEGEVDHNGTVKVLEGTIEITTTNDEMLITSATLIADMNTISEGNPKLEKHLKNQDFFDVNKFASAEFSFGRHEAGKIYGVATVVGKDVPIEATVELTMEDEVVRIEVGDFRIDFAVLEMPFFIADVLEPVNEQHDSSIGFSATIITKVKMY